MSRLKEVIFTDTTRIRIALANVVLAAIKTFAWSAVLAFYIGTLAILGSPLAFFQTTGRVYVVIVPSFLGFFSIAAAALAFNGFRGTCSSILALVFMIWDTAYSLVVPILGIYFLPTFYIECSGKVVYGIIFFVYLI